MIGRAIKVKRVINDLTQSDVSNRVSINLSQLSLYEQGHRMIPVDTFAAICSVFNMTPKQMADFARKIEQEKTKAA